MNRRDFLKSIGVAVAALLALKVAKIVELPVFPRAKFDPDDGGYLLPPEITEQLLELQKLDPADRHIENSTTIRWHVPVTEGEERECGEWNGPIHFRLKG